MSPNIGVSPTPTLVAEWSPSAYNTLTRCPLAQAFDRDQVLRKAHRRGSTFSATGNVAHSLAERIARHEFEGVPIEELKASLATAWDAEAQGEYEKLCAEWSPARPPIPRDWPFFAATKARTLLRLKTDAVRYREWAAQGGVGNAPLVEEKMRDDTLALAGRSDRIERQGDQVTIVDLKSGANVTSITDDNRRQLMLYAHLYRTVHGVTPHAIAVMTSQGQRFEEAVDDVALDAVMTQFRDVTTRFNEAVTSGVDFVQLATPSREACNWCSYRPVCSRYWNSITEDWEAKDGAGQILTVQSPTSFTVSLQFPLHRQGEVLPVVDAAPADRAVGDLAIIVDAFPDAATLRCNWNSRITSSKSVVH